MKRDNASAVLVTGGAGYIGSHTCKALARAGYVPVTYDNLRHGHRWSVRWGPLVEGDISDAPRLQAALTEHSVEAVIHFAAAAHGAHEADCSGQPGRDDAANTLALLRAVHACGVTRFILSSSGATYGIAQGAPVAEESGQVPVNASGEAKLVAEKMLRWWGSVHGLRWMALRYFNAAGSDPEGELGEDHDPETHLIPLAIEAALGRRAHLEVYGTDYPTADGTAVRDYVHVSDLALAHVQALRKLESGAHSTAFNLGAGAGHSVREVVAMVERVSGRRVPWKSGPRRPGDAPELVARVARARRFLDWQPRHSSLETIVQTAWRWHSLHHAQVALGQPAAPPQRGLGVMRRLRAALRAG